MCFTSVLKNLRGGLLRNMLSSDLTHLLENKPRTDLTNLMTIIQSCLYCTYLHPDFQACFKNYLVQRVVTPAALSVDLCFAILRLPSPSLGACIASLGSFLVPGWNWQEPIPCVYSHGASIASSATFLSEGEIGKSWYKASRPNLPQTLQAVSSSSSCWDGYKCSNNNFRWVPEIASLGISGYQKLLIFGYLGTWNCLCGGYLWLPEIAGLGIYGYQWLSLGVPLVTQGVSGFQDFFL